ncbi:MAG TPA: prepilin peptidase [Acidobacteriota bacterium]|nr:prepilin peptidase [Acidobacteriota bacterium]
MHSLEAFHQIILHTLRVFPLWFVLLYVFVLGTIVGSFLNVCIYRIPLGISIVSPRSSCPSCHHGIPWYHNIPILSYLWLRGKCSFCRERISPVYPFVEFLTGVYFLMLLIFFGPYRSFVIYAVFGSIMIALIFIDYYHRLLPRVITFPGVALGFASSFVNPYVNPWQSGLGILLGALLPISVLVAYKWLRKKEGMGHGDIVMLAMVGAFLGWKMVFVVILFASFAGVLVGIPIIYIMKKGSDFPLPFGTFIGAVALLAVFWGRWIWNLYFFRLGV